MTGRTRLQRIDVLTESSIPFRIGKIDHVVLKVHDIKKMVEFYTVVLGCIFEREAEGCGLVQLRAGDSLLDLLVANSESDLPTQRPPARGVHIWDHFCLQVSPWDSDAIIAYLDRHLVRHGPIEQRYGAEGLGPSIYLSDPEGNSIELKGKNRA